MHAGSDIALIDIIGWNDEESPEIEGFGGHDWFIERARGR